MVLPVVEYRVEPGVDAEDEGPGYAEQGPADGVARLPSGDHEAHGAERDDDRRRPDIVELVCEPCEKYADTRQRQDKHAHDGRRNRRGPAAADREGGGCQRSLACGRQRESATARNSKPAMFRDRYGSSCARRRTYADPTLWTRSRGQCKTTPPSRRRLGRVQRQGRQPRQTTMARRWMYLIASLTLTAGCGASTARLATHDTPASPESVSSAAVGSPPAYPPRAPEPVTPARSAPAASVAPSVRSLSRRAADPAPQHASQGPPPHPGPQHPTRPRTLTESDSGTTIHLRPGQSVNVRLHGGQNNGYHQPTSSSSVMRRVSASGGYPSDQPARAEFTAAGPGSADLSSYTDFTCLHTTPRCLPPQQQWVVHVIVR